MMDSNLLQGTMVRLAARDPETDAAAVAGWSVDTEYLRLFDAEPAYPRSVAVVRRQLEQLGESRDQFSFLIYRLVPDDPDPIGLIELDGIEWTHGEGWLGIGLGARDCWGQGYGTDAVKLILRYGFTELNLHRISLTVFAYNSRAIRLYRRLGFVEEGRAREFLQRDGRRWDMIFMGLLRTEWQSLAITRPRAPGESRTPHRSP